MPVKPPGSCLPLLWSTCHPTCFRWESFKCIHQHLASDLENLDEARTNSRLMLVAGHLPPPHRKTCLRITKATIQGGRFLRAAAGPWEVGNFVVVFYQMARKCGLLSAATTRWEDILLLTPQWHWRMWVLLSSLWIRAPQTPSGMVFFNSTNVPSVCSSDNLNLVCALVCMILQEQVAILKHRVIDKISSQAAYEKEEKPTKMTLPIWVSNRENKLIFKDKASSRTNSVYSSWNNRLWVLLK